MHSSQCERLGSLHFSKSTKNVISLSRGKYREIYLHAGKYSIVWYTGISTSSGEILKWAMVSIPRKKMASAWHYTECIVHTKHTRGECFCRYILESIRRVMVEAHIYPFKLPEGWSQSRHVHSCGQFQFILGAKKELNVLSKRIGAVKWMIHTMTRWIAGKLNSK